MSEGKKTVILGASTNPERYAWKAANRLKEAGHSIVPVGAKAGVVAGVEILTVPPVSQDVDTVTVYLGPQHQPAYYDYVRRLNPKRVIFNPGTENPTWQQELQQQGIEPVEACTLVLLSTHQY